MCKYILSAVILKFMNLLALKFRQNVFSSFSVMVKLLLFNYPYNTRCSAHIQPIPAKYWAGITPWQYESI